MSRQLTPNFREHEVVNSDDHPELTVPFEVLPARVAANAQRILDGFMQPVRDHTGGPIGVESFYRGPELNDATPGSKPDSDHLDANAVDWRPLGAIQPADLLEDIKAGRVRRATWDKLNYYTATRTFHVSQRPLEEGQGRKRIYVDWQRVA